MSMHHTHGFAFGLAWVFLFVFNLKDYRNRHSVYTQICCFSNLHRSKRKIHPFGMIRTVVLSAPLHTPHALSFLSKNIRYAVQSSHFFDRATKEGCIHVAWVCWHSGVLLEPSDPYPRSPEVNLVEAFQRRLHRSHGVRVCAKHRCSYSMWMGTRKGGCNN